MGVKFDLVNFTLDNIFAVLPRGKLLNFSHWILENLNFKLTDIQMHLTQTQLASCFYNHLTYAL